MSNENNDKQNFLKNKLEYVFKAVDWIHGRLQKSLFTQIVVIALVLGVGLYTEVSNFVLVPYGVLSAIFLLITLVPYLSSLGASELKENFEEISEAFEASKQSLHDAKQLKSGKELSVKSISKHIEFAEQITNLPDLSADTLDNTKSLVSLLNPASMSMMAVSQVSMYVQYVVLAVATLIFII